MEIYKDKNQNLCQKYYKARIWEVLQKMNKIELLFMKIGLIFKEKK